MANINDWQKNLWKHKNQATSDWNTWKVNVPPHHTTTGPNTSTTITTPYTWQTGTAVPYNPPGTTTAPNTSPYVLAPNIAKAIEELEKENKEREKKAEVEQDINTLIEDVDTCIKGLDQVIENLDVLAETDDIDLDNALASLREAKEAMQRALKKQG